MSIDLLDLVIHILHVMFVDVIIGLTDLDMCLVVDKLLVPSDDNTQGTMEKLENKRSNCLSLMNIKKSLSHTIPDNVLSYDTTKEFLDAFI